MPALATRDAIQTIGLTKRFGRTLALDQLNLTAEAGEVFGFLGPNGAGKSTTIRMLLGHLRPTAGQAWIFGDAAADAAAAHRHLAYVPADVALWPALTGAETLELLADIAPRINRRYRDELVDRFELEVDRRCGTYRPLPRSRWALVQIAVLIAGVVGLALATGVAIAIGTALAGANLRPTEALAGALNVVPVAALCLGAAQVAIGWVPQAVLALGALPALGGFLLTVLADTFDWPNWLAQLSPFAHLAAGMMVVSVLPAGLGIAGFVRRDLRA